MNDRTLTNFTLNYKFVNCFNVFLPMMVIPHIARRNHKINYSYFSSAFINWFWYNTILLFMFELTRSFQPRNWVSTARYRTRNLKPNRQLGMRKYQNSWGHDLQQIPRVLWTFYYCEEKCFDWSFFEGDNDYGGVKTGLIGGDHARGALLPPSDIDPAAPSILHSQPLFSPPIQNNTTVATL